MNNLAFEWTESNSLAAELTKPPKQVSVEFETHGSPMFVTIWRSDGTGLRVSSEMHDVAERIEVGVLCFSRIFAPISDATFVDVASTFDTQVTPFKLMIHESGTSAESGVILKAGGEDNDVIIVASVKPYCLAIRGILSSVPHIFEPEYPIDRYERVPFV